MRRKGTPIGQYGSDLDFGVPPLAYITLVYKFKVTYKNNIIIKDLLHSLYYTIGYRGENLYTFFLSY